MNTQKQLYIKTPILESHRLRKERDKTVFYKMECYQPTGSFKIRGMEALCRHHLKEGKSRFISSSGGNAGYSMAYVGKKLGVQVKVVVPETTSPFMIDKIRNLDAEVTVFGKVWDEAHEYALGLCEGTNAIYVSPFDDPLLWDGHATMIDECAAEMAEPDKIVVSVGGGGLLCGVFEGMKRNGWQKAQVITTETEGAASFATSFEAQKIVTLPAINSIATSLGAKQITPKALALSSQFKVTPLVTSDRKAVDAALKFLGEYNALVEPACGVSLAVPYFYPELIEQGERVLVIVCGGVSMGVEKLLAY